MSDLFDQGIEAIKNLCDPPRNQVTLGIDIDGVCDEANSFFNPLSHIWPGKVVIISYRSDRKKAESDLDRLGIRYDELVLVNSFEAKAKEVSRLGVAVFFDDQPEMLKEMPSTVSVMLVRNGGNFDFSSKKWMFSSKTAFLIDS
ncbi:MAG: hypothetical protein R3C18_24925 [Planctomycetaceae bacterium]